MASEISLSRVASSTQVIDGSGNLGIPFDMQAPRFATVGDYIARAKQFFGASWSTELETTLRARYALAQQEQPWSKKGRGLPVTRNDLYQAGWSVNDDLRAADKNSNGRLSVSELQATRQQQTGKLQDQDIYVRTRASATVSQIDYLLKKLADE